MQENAWIYLISLPPKKINLKKLSEIWKKLRKSEKKLEGGQPSAAKNYPQNVEKKSLC